MSDYTDKFRTFGRLGDGDVVKFDKKLPYIIIIALVIRSFGLNLVLFDDEVNNPMMMRYLSKGQYPPYQDHPPGLVISNYLNHMFKEIVFSLSGVRVPLRFMSLVFGLGTILIVYEFTKLLYDERVALVASLIMALSFYHIWASLQLEMNGSSLTLLITLVLYFYYRYSCDKKNKWLVGSGISFGLALWLNFTVLIVLPVIILFKILISDLKEWMDIGVISGIGFFIFLIFPLSAFLINKPEISS